MSSERQAGLAPTRQVLSNGAIVLAKESRATPAVAISATVAAGTIVDPPDVPGTAWFLSRVLDRGTERRSAEEIGEWLDARGIALAFGVSRHQLGVSCTCLSEDFHATLELIGEILAAPALPEHEIETRRVEIVTAIRQDQDNPAAMAAEECLGMLYPGGHPYGRRVKGSIDSVEQVDRSLLAACHARHVLPSTLVLACVGDVDPAQVLDQGARVFGCWSARGDDPIPAPALPPAAERRRSALEIRGKAQADVAYGFVAMPRGDPSYYAFSILNNVLGQYALGGRLGDNIRERQGMAYYVYSAFDANPAAGPLLIRAGVNPANVERTIASIDEELRKLAAEGVTAQELSASRTYLVGSMPRTLETNAGIAQFLQAGELFGLGLDYDVRLPSLLDAVSLDEVNGLARRFLVPERAAIAVAGPPAP
jgi:zinc protease